MLVSRSGKVSSDNADRCLSPLNWGYEALLALEFRGRLFTIDVVEFGQLTVPGDVLVTRLGAVRRLAS
eukprot:tig00020563_g11248.t1